MYNFNKATQIEPKNIDAWLNKALTLYNMRKYQEAKECYDTVLKIDPTNVDALNSKNLYPLYWFI
jgi:tetratricopeptide (TPR) repeat protein